MKQAQDKIKQFDKSRGWENSWNVKDLLLNITEEGGELWDMIKWVDDEKQRQVINKNKDKASDYIGDTLFLLLKLANQMDVDSEKALQETLNEYEKRMPSEKIKQVGHANKFAGGVDEK